MLSNILRNLIAQLPIPLFSNSVQAVLVTLHNVIGIDLNEPRTTWYGEQFHVISVLFPQEDLAANPLQLLIFCIAGLGLLRSHSSIIAYLYVSLIAAFCVFSGLLKWQPWHSRLLLPLFSLSTVVSCAILLEKRRLLRFAMSTSATFAVLVLAFNVSRPLISYDLLYPFLKQLVTTVVAVPQSIYVKPRIDQYFNPRPYWEEPYREISSEVAEHAPAMRGIDLIDGFQYPFWVLLKQKQPGITIVPRQETSQYIFYTATAPRPYQRQHRIQAPPTGTYGCFAELRIGPSNNSN